MLTILAIWVIASVPLGILVGTLIRKAGEGAQPYGAGGLVSPATMTRAVAVDPSRSVQIYPLLVLR